MTNKQRKKLLSACADDPYCTVNKDKSLVTVHHNGLKMLFSYNVKHDCGSGNPIAIRTIRPNHSKPISNQLTEIVDATLVSYAKTVLDDSKKVTGKLQKIVTELEDTYG